MLQCRCIIWLEYGDNYSKTSGTLNQFCIDDPKYPIGDSEAFKLRSRLLNNTNNDGITGAVITVPSKDLSNFWRTFEMSLINCEIGLILTKSAICVISKKNRATTFTKADEKLYIPLYQLKIM